MQANGPPTGSGGAASRPAGREPGERRPPPLHSRGHGPTKCGASRTNSAVGQVAQAVFPAGELTAGRAELESAEHRGERWPFLSHPCSAGPAPPQGSEAGAPEVRLRRRVAGLRAVPDVGASGRGSGVSSHASRCGRLASRRLHPTRLETRTKECNRRASPRARETRERNEGEGGTRRPPRREPLLRRAAHRRPIRRRVAAGFE